MTPAADPVYVPPPDPYAPSPATLPAAYAPHVAPVTGPPVPPVSDPRELLGQIGPTGRVDMRRPGVVTFLAVMNLLTGALALLGAVGILVVAAGEKSSEDAVVAGVLGIAYFVIGALSVGAGVGMLQMRSWGRILQIVLAFIGLLAIGCGTIVSVLILVYMFRPGVKVLFSGKTADELTPQEAADVWKVSQSSGAVAVLVAVVAVLGTVAVIGLIAAIAIPSLLRARVSANEAGTLGKIRTIISAEEAYASGNGGFYDTPRCLRAPASCVQGAPAQDFLSDYIVFDAPSSGYVFTFHPGPTPETLPAPVSRSSMASYAVTAVPIKEGQTGIRSFCADSSGMICVLDPSTTRAEGGVCPSSCRPLR